MTSTASSLVSVVLPITSCNNELPAALQSVLSQNYFPLELVIVISTDVRAACGEKLETLLNDSAIQEKYGMALVVCDIESAALPYEAARFGVENARGEYIAFLDANDRFEKEHISTLMRCMQHSEAQVGFGLLDVCGARNYSYYRYLQQIMRFEHALQFFPTAGLACLAMRELLPIGNIIISRTMLSRLRGVPAYHLLYQQAMVLHSLFYAEPAIAPVVMDTRIMHADDDEKRKQQEAEEMQRMLEEFMFRACTEMPENTHCLSPSRMPGFFTTYIDLLKLQDVYHCGLHTAQAYRYNQVK